MTTRLSIYQKKIEMHWMEVMVEVQQRFNTSESTNEDMEGEDTEQTEIG